MEGMNVEIFVSLARRNRLAICARQLWFNLTVYSYQLKHLLSCMCISFFHRLFVALLDAVTRANRFLNGNQSALEPVYDILNAGPRHRFCTPSLVVHNCLGLGYGCAGAKFQYVAKIMAGLDLSLDDAKEAVSDYRAANPGVTALWQKLNYEAKCCCARGIPLEIKLPSWRSLVYENLRHDPVRGLLGDPAQGVTRKIYGGLLTENVVQAIARDIFVQRMCELADAGYGPSFHVHDEYVIPIPGYPEDIERAKARIQEICRKPIEWLPSCPLDIDIVIAPCYQK